MKKLLLLFFLNRIDEPYPVGLNTENSNDEFLAETSNVLRVDSRQLS